MNDFAESLNKYFTSYLSNQFNASDKTIKTYKEAFRILFRYFKEVKKIDIKNLSYTDFNKENILNFLDYLEQEKNNSISTRNNRLAVYKSFCNYLLNENPQYLDTLSKILNIKAKKYIKKIPVFLSENELKLLLQQPSQRKNEEIKNLLIMCILYDSGCRVNELINLKVQDIIIKTECIIKVLGKGNKERLIPLSSKTSELLNIYLKNTNIDNENYLFTNKQGTRYTSEGITYIINKYVTKMKKHNSNFNKNVTAHTFRHTRAIHLLVSGADIITIRDLLGHVDIATTQHYARIASEEKLRIIRKHSNESLTDIPDWNKSGNTILKELGLI